MIDLLKERHFNYKNLVSLNLYSPLLKLRDSSRVIVLVQWP